MGVHFYDGQSEDSGVVEVLRNGGSGGEADVWVELRTRFPGIGRTIVTSEGVAAARRKQHFSDLSSGARTFLKHLVIKKLDDYFYRGKKYVYSHIPRPFGSETDEQNGESWYFYEWTFGSEGFAWYEFDGARSVPVPLKDWNEFVGLFGKAGIEVSMDVADVDDGRISKNIIHQYLHRTKSDMDGPGVWNPLWKRIDFGDMSCAVRWGQLQSFINSNREDMVEKLRADRVYMLDLIAEYFVMSQQLDDRDKGRLEVLIGDYRVAVLKHHAMGFGPATAGPQLRSLGEKVP